MDGNRAAPIWSEIDRMPETPPRQHRPNHRRARSDTFFSGDGDGIDELLLFDPSDIDFFSLDFMASNNNPPPPLVSPMAVDSPSDDSSSNAILQPAAKPTRHVRSLSVDSDFFDGVGDNSNIKKGVGMGIDKLAELSLVDPKKAKRILANRQSAARSKERKIRYASELEKKVQTLQTEATSLSTQVTILQRRTTDLNAENNELRLRLEAFEQEAQLRDALNEALKEKLQGLRIAAGEIPRFNENHSGRAETLQDPSQRPRSALRTPYSSAVKTQASSFMDFNKRV